MNRKGANAPRDAGDDVLSEMLLIGLALALCWTVGAGIEAGLRFVGIELIRGDQ